MTWKEHCIYALHAPRIWPRAMTSKSCGAAEERKVRKMRPESMGRNIPHKGKK